MYPATVLPMANARVTLTHGGIALFGNIVTIFVEYGIGLLHDFVGSWSPSSGSGPRKYSADIDELLWLAEEHPESLVPKDKVVTLMGRLASAAGPIPTIWRYFGGILSVVASREKSNRLSSSFPHRLAAIVCVRSSEFIHVPVQQQRKAQCEARTCHDGCECACSHSEINKAADIAALRVSQCAYGINTTQLVLDLRERLAIQQCQKSQCTPNNHYSVDTVRTHFLHCAKCRHERVDEARREQLRAKVNTAELGGFDEVLHHYQHTTVWPP
eukprot:COSAG02_NODE_438_length_22319_cov_17.198425_18_plen_271_part_00